ncbi:glucose dehydrogenase [FAD, quinone]-like [Rhipicephalus microplus]|uniref:glucose dehydrogenase [FAD, quinone]-like n=1 Tax=Rhipicephalus microplus TaxID=6941 RepID=UPI003F6D6DB5
MRAAKDNERIEALGGGSAGCVLANRLSADPSTKVLLIEAGGMEKHYVNLLLYPRVPIDTQIPLFAPLIIGSEVDWKHYPEPQSQACLAMENQVCRLARGKGLGGSSAMNFMLYVRGNRRDYEIWRDQFNATGWGYQDVLKHFKNIETSEVPFQDQEYRGTSGEVPVTYARLQTTLSTSFLYWCLSNGYKITDYNERSQAGCSRVQANIKNGQRWSANKAFIVPILFRDNLHISMLSHATKVIFHGKRAIGVRFIRRDREFNIMADREVVISAGAIGSPQLLMLSGIGPRSDLEKLQIPAIAYLPVGENLQDHMHVPGISGTLRLPWSISFWGYIWHRLWNLGKEIPAIYPGELTIPGSIEALAFVSTSFVNESLEFPDVEIALQSFSSSDNLFEYYLARTGLRKEVYNQYYLPHRNNCGFSLVPVMNRPKSRGYVKLRTAQPSDKPIINPRYLSHPEDVKVAIEGVKIALRLMNSEIPMNFTVQPWNIPLKQCEGTGPIWSDPYLECFVRHMAHTTWHPCCTCAMGWHKGAVVDHELRVWGVQKLRVVDASVMPTIVTGNLNVPTMMIADKAAEMILKANPLIKQRY